MKKMQNNFNEIVNSHLIYAKTDENLIIKSMSKAFGNLLGYAQDEIIGKNYNILVQNKDSQKFYNGCEYVNTNSEESCGTDIQMISKHNDTVYTHTFIYPSFVDGVLDGFVFTVQDMHDTFVLNNLKVKQLSEEKYQETTMEFMKGTSVAILNKVSSKISLVVKIISFTIFMFFVWAISFDIEEIVRGEGKIIPTTKVKSIKNLEGGIVSIIHIKEGDRVKNGQILLKLDDISYKIKLDENSKRLAEFNAKKIRLEAEANNIKMKKNIDFESKYPKFIKIEKNRYITNSKELKSKIAKFDEQLKSNESVLKDTKNSFLVLEENYLSRAEELEESRNLSQKGIFSKYDIAIIQREVNGMLSDLMSAKEKQNQTRNAINEIKNKIKEAKFAFQNNAKEEYGKVVSEISRIEEIIKDLKETTKRTSIRTPVDGVIKELLVNTIGSSINPSEELVTIVPDNVAMISEVKIAPKDIGKLFIGQKIFLKVTAFDYAIYGNLEGEITNISPDTKTDKQSGNTYYLVQIKTKKNYLDNNKKYKLKVGMKVNTDIIVGKKTILDFVLKPILRSTQKD